MSSDLVTRAMAGDREAFDLLLGSSIHQLYAIADRILRDADRAADAVQEALVAAWRDLPGLRDPARFDAWLHRLLVRACYREARRARSGPWRVALLEHDEPVVDDVGGRLADRDRVDRAFRRLSAEHRAVIVVTHYLGLGGSEAAAVLDIPAGTVKSRLFHATRAMRAAIEADERPGPVNGARSIP